MCVLDWIRDGVRTLQHLRYMDIGEGVRNKGQRQAGTLQCVNKVWSSPLRAHMPHRADGLLDCHFRRCCRRRRRSHQGSHRRATCAACPPPPARDLDLPRSHGALPQSHPSPSLAKRVPRFRPPLGLRGSQGQCLEIRIACPRRFLEINAMHDR